ncbi:MAG: asparagine synthase (glutamine-hydrolyzing) [Bryobacteraceae bacterium]
MCGIAGYTHWGRAVDESGIRRVGGTLVHRGPDQQGVFHSRDVSLAAVRLKIIDLGGGDQPMATEDGHTVIVFNGEVYNHVELRRELESLGHHFVSSCDTEVVLRAFVQWDTESFRRLRGMFAIAIWQAESRRLILARDRMGIKPLYFLERGHDVYFASELKALFECEEVPRQLDLTALDYYLALNFVPQPYTLVDGITKLAPGEYLEWREGRIRRERYWQLRFAPSSHWTLEGAKEALDGLLRESVREHLVSDVPLGIWSSGGLDSSAILHYAAEASSSRLKTFSVSFQGRSFDESKYFREVAAQYGTEHHEFDLNPEVELADALEQFAYYSDEPSADAGALPVWFLSRMSRRFVTVALSGDGGDELFGGYATYLADRYARWMRWSPRWMRRAALAMSHLGLPVSDDKISFEYKVKRMLEGSLLPGDEAHFFWNGTGSAEQRAALLPGRGGASLADLAGRAAPPDPAVGYLNRYLLIDHNYYLPDDILYKVDRMSMAHSLEVRPPFLDHRIVEFAATLPQNFKIRGATLKFLLRELMKDKLPPSVIRRSKMGFDVPAHDWFRGPLKSLLLDTVTMDSVRNTGVFSRPAIERLMADHLERRRNYGYHLWGLLTLFLWMRQWKIGTALEPTAEQALAAN